MNIRQKIARQELQREQDIDTAESFWRRLLGAYKKALWTGFPTAWGGAPILPVMPRSPYFPEEPGEL